MPAAYTVPPRVPTSFETSRRRRIDKETLKKLEPFKVGDKVKVSWAFEEHYRIENIVRVE